MKWYYSETLKLYISLEALKVNNQIIQIAKEKNIHLEWDDYGNLMMLDFAEFKTIVKALGGVILSPAEYWQVYGEALQYNHSELLESLSTDKFTEILDRVYIDEQTYIDHPDIIGEYEYIGEKVTYQKVVGRPGWIAFEDIDLATGHPKQVHEKLPHKAQMKYWSPDLANTEVKKAIALRGYVTSVAMMSLDLGIPADTRQPKMMVRFCTTQKPAEFLTIEEQAEISRVLESQTLSEMEAFMTSDSFAKLKASNENEAVRLRETIYHKVGAWRVEKGTLGDNLLTYGAFDGYMKRNRELLDNALANGQMITFVTGHKNPDADTVISSVFEAYRLSLENPKEDMVYLPLIQSDSMPKEIQYILGQSISHTLLYSTRLALAEWIKGGFIQFVFTDQNYQKEYQRYVTLITDHHRLSSHLSADEMQVPCYIEAAGSCTSLIVRKYIGQGYDFDQRLSQMLQAAMLMDTENRVSHKMTPWDKKVMDLFREKANITSEDVLYQKLMTELIGETDPEKLYKRDYKHFFGFGFAVLKVTGLMDKATFDKWLEIPLQLAMKDNYHNNDYVTIVKVTDYDRDGLKVHKERLYCVWNVRTEQCIRDKVLELLIQIVKLSMPQAHICKQYDFLEVSHSGKQLSRKKMVPAIECLLRYYGQYVYMESIHKWVARDFLKQTDAMKEQHFEYETDAKGRVCNITFREAKSLMAHLGMEMLSLKEYWQVYEQARQLQDNNLLESLTNGDFLEFLDTCCDKEALIHHPQIEGDSLNGNREKVEIRQALPGLISPKYIDYATGLPSRIFSAANYTDKELWRYWSPPQDKCYVFSRSYIFLLEQPCLDAKATPGESFINMGIRPIRNTNLNMEIQITTESGKLQMKYKSEYDKTYTVVFEESFGRK